MLKIVADLGTRRELSGHWVRWVRWVRYLCICGNEAEARIQAIKSGKQKSCGCLNKAMPKKEKKKGHVVATSKYRKNHPDMYKVFSNKYHHEFYARFASLKSVAKRRGLIMLITKEQHKILLGRPCYYCNRSLLNETGLGLDRIDNNKKLGYTIDNVLPCCGDCNRTRGDRFTVDEMKFITEKLIEYRNRNK